MAKVTRVYCHLDSGIGIWIIYRSLFGRGWDG